MSISIQISPTCLMRDLAETLSSKPGFPDIYCWYEGTEGLPASGASFYREKLFDPLLQKKSDLLLSLYSLQGWDFKKKPSELSESPIGQMINRTNLAAIRCLSATSFFQFCLSIPQNSDLSRWIIANLPKKKWLLNLSAHSKPLNQSVAQFFENCSTPFDPIKDLDINRAYSYLQYIEGYYLIREAVARALAQNRTSVQVVFVLPNNESKYYKDLPKDLKPMLIADFGKSLDSLIIDVSFRSFHYGENSSRRPYIDKSEKATFVAPEKVLNYLPCTEVTS